MATATMNETVEVYMHCGMRLDRVSPAIRSRAFARCRANNEPENNASYHAGSILREAAIARLGRVATRLDDSTSPFRYRGDRAKIAKVCEDLLIVNCYA